MAEQDDGEKTYEEKEQRLDEILRRLDNSETPMDELADEAREAAELIKSMHGTINRAKTEISEIFAELDEVDGNGQSPEA